MSHDVLVRDDGAVRRIELARPDCGNLVTSEMVVAIAQAIASLPGGAKALVLHGRGADFCKGRDYTAAPEAARQGRTPSALEIRRTMTDPMVALYTSLRECPVPTIAAVQGLACGFGCAFACACDIVLVAESARLGLPEMGRGLPPTLAMSALWDRVSPRGLAYLVYSTAEIDARTAWTIGLASTVVPDAELGASTEALLSTISRQPLDAIRAVKEYLVQAPAMNAAGRGALGAGLFAAVLSSR